MCEAVIRISQLSKKYKHNTALDYFEMTVHKGAIYGFVGENGAGKTTTMRLIAGLAFPTAGRIELFQEDHVKRQKNVRGRIGMMIELPAFYPYLSAYDNLEYYRRYKGIEKAQVIETTLELVGLAEVGKKKYKNFSLGMKQRLGLALALLNSPDLLILDEPLNGLDPKGIVEIREILRRLNTEENITIVIASHNLEELSLIATTYGFIHKGKMLREISAEKLTQECGDYILLKVDEVEQAVIVLEEEFATKNYVVVSRNEIQLYDCLDQTKLINQKLVERGIGVEKIQQQGLSLENYYLQLLQESEA